jgi:hemerythrin-like domain-containing protein
MDIFEELTRDHRLIFKVVDAFEQFIDATGSDDIDLFELNRFVVFFREFVELTHHDREERFLLPAMESLGYARNGGPLTHIREEHERERNLLLELRRAAVRQRQPIGVEKARVLRTARDLVAFERAHMKKENELLYPNVKKDLAGRTLSEVGRQVGAHAGTWSRAVEQTWILSLADELVEAHPSPANTDALLEGATR